MSTEHTILRMIGCHTRVNEGNFSEDERLLAHALFDRGDLIKTRDEHGNTWLLLSRVGQERLWHLNGGSLDKHEMN